MITSPISLDPYTQSAMPAQNQQLINLDPGIAPGFTPTPEQADRKAATVAAGIPELGKSQKDISQGLQQGNEEGIRREATAKINQKQQQTTETAVKQWATKQSNLTYNDIREQIQAPQVNPQTVFEDKFAETFTDPMLNMADPFTAKTFMPQLLDDQQAHVLETKKATDKILSFRQYINHRVEQSEQVAANQSWLGYGVDFLKSQLALYQEFKLRGMEGKYDFSQFLGDNLDKQRINLWNMPPEKRVQAFDTMMSQLEKDNPSLAVLFGHAMAGMASSELDRLGESSAAMVLTGDLAIGGGIAKNLIFGVAKDAAKAAATVGPQFTMATIPSMFGQEAIRTMSNKLGTGAFKEAAYPRMFGPGEMSHMRDMFPHIEGLDDRFVKPRELTPYEISEMQTKAARAGITANVWSEADPSMMTPSFIKSINVFDIRRAAAAGAGNMDEAAINKIASQAMKIIEGKDNPIEEAIEAMPTFLRSEASFYRTNPGNSGQEQANRVSEQTLNSQITLEKTLNEVLRVQRTPVLVVSEDVARRIKETVRRKYSGPNSAILGEGDPTWYPASNTYHVDVVIGNHDASYFSTEAQAKSFANVYGMQGTVVERQGMGWFIKATVPVNETEDGIRDALIKMPGAWAGSASKGKRGGTATPYLEDPITGKPSQRRWDIVQAYTNSLFGGYRSPEETLSVVENEQRKVATFGAQRLMQMFNDNNALIKAGNTKEFKRLLIRAQTEIDPATKETGRFYHSIGDFEQSFQNVNNRLPTGKETEAYFAFKNDYEMERALRSLLVIRNKSRGGFLEYRVRRLSGVSGELEESPWFDARPLDKLPTDRSPVYISTAGRETTLSATNINSAVRKELEEGISKGELKVLEIYDRDQEPLSGWSDKVGQGVRYVVTHNMDMRPLQFERQVPRRGGGHWIFEYDHYLKQADVYHNKTTDQYIYRGDITAMPFQLRALGEQIGNHLNTIREHLRNNDVAAARNYTNNIGVAGLDFDRDVHPWFKPQRNAQGQFTAGARFNLTEPFRMVSADKKIIDLDDAMQRKYGPDFLDGTMKGNYAKANMVEFTGKRDSWNLHTIDNDGSWNQPVFQYRPAKLMDPIDALNRGMAKISNSSFMDDYKYMAVEHWLQTFLPHLDYKALGMGSVEEMRHSPFYVFANAKFNKDVPGNVAKIGESNRKKVMDFVGQPSAVRNDVNKATALIMDSLYRSNVSTKLIPYEKLAVSKDPLAVTRSLVADMKLGLGSIPAFFMQASAFSNVAAINYKQAAAATLGTFLHNWTRVAPHMLDHFDAIASTKMLNWLPGMSKWLPGQFKEANLILREQTGFSQVGSEHAMFDSMLKDRGVGTAFDSLRYWGRTFFREGAQFVRNAAWYSAYREFRDLNPTKVLDRADKAWILNRASLLDHDMNRAANSSINSGVMSVPAQFYTYARNLAEDMYGKRLTWQEKARVFSINGALWGIPAGAIGLYGFPMGDIIREKAEKYLKYIPGQNTGWTFALDGGLSLLGGYITGGGDPQAGTYLNFSRFGVKGWDPINNAMDSDKTIWDFIGGATFSTIKNTIFRSRPFLDDMYYLMTGQGDKHKPVMDDFVSLGKEISSVSYFNKTLTALRTGVWASNQATPLEPDVPAWQAIVGGLTGMTSVDVSDIGTRRDVIQGREEHVKDITNRISREFSLALLAGKSGDEEGRNTHYTRVNTLLEQSGLNPKDRIQLLHRIASRKEDLVHSQQYDLTTRNVPEDQLQAEMERYSEWIRMRKARTGNF